MNFEKDLKWFVASLCLIGFICTTGLSRAQSARPFTVADDIGITQVGDIWTGTDTEPIWSPDERLVALHLTSASLKDGLLHDRIVVYSVEALLKRLAMEPTGQDENLKPQWEFEISAKPNDWGNPATEELSWLDDSSGIAFLRWTPNGTRQLCVAELAQKRVSVLTPADQHVMSFAIRDRYRFVYTVPSLRYIEQQRKRLQEPERVVTGEKLPGVLYPELYLKESGRADVWASDGAGKTHPIIDPNTHEPIFVYGRGINSLSLSHDGANLATILPMKNVPAPWAQDYGPPYVESPMHVRAGTQDLDAPYGNNYVGRYATVSLKSGEATLVADSPDVVTAGWLEGAFASVVWSPNDHFLFVPGLFIGSAERRSTQRPCYAVLELASHAVTCVSPMHGATVSGRELGYSRLHSTRFQGNATLEVDLNREGRIERFVKDQDRWVSEGSRDKESHRLEVKVVAGPMTPPRLVLTEQSASHSATVLELNPQLKGVSMGDVESFQWSDGLNHEWQGMLFLPVGYEKGKRYPLVIQNHGVMKDSFAPSGEFPSAFAAQELAATGIMVLQVQDCPGRGTPSEVGCNVRAYDAAVSQLSREGRVDPDRVGLIGFSRTVAYVMSALVNGTVRYRAASITDGFNLSLMTYALTVSDERFTNDDLTGLIGGEPRGNGLFQWLRNSPDLNVDKIQTPLRVATKRDASVLPMWEPYAFLKAAGKPTEIVVLNTSEHVINDPRVRFAAQGTVEWFRFWLQGWESANPEKAGQYRRWKGMTTLSKE